MSIAVKLDDSLLEKNTNRACQDEESGQEISSKPEKPKSIIRSVPTLDIVEGKKKIIAFIIYFFPYFVYLCGFDRKDNSSLIVRGSETGSVYWK